MIQEVSGDLLKANVEALVNAVNTEGTMGKGIALQFKQTYPAMFREYQQLCKLGRLKTGQVHSYHRDGADNPRYIINFPTKRDWRDKSELSYIEDGLPALISAIQANNILSIAIPALGCGLGGLKWTQVKPLIQTAFAPLPSVQVLLYPPQ